MSRYWQSMDRNFVVGADGSLFWCMVRAAPPPRMIGRTQPQSWMWLQPYQTDHQEAFVADTKNSHWLSCLHTQFGLPQLVPAWPRFHAIEDSGALLFCRALLHPSFFEPNLVGLLVTWLDTAFRRSEVLAPFRDGWKTSSATNSAAADF